MKKNGFLLAENVLKMVIALICIGFLIYLLFSLYYGNQKAKQLEQAKASLDIIVKAINSGDSSALIYNPSNWFIESWPYEGTMPKSCSSFGWENCICVCGTTSSINQRAADKCDDSGVCINQEKEIIVMGVGGKQSPIRIDDTPVTVNIDNKERII